MQEAAPMLSQRTALPTHAQIIQLLNHFLPPRSNDVPLLYHTPRHSTYDPSSTPVSHIVLSVTPTPGVYGALNCAGSTPHPPICFLHRPWALDRRAVRPGTLVLSSHVSFDAYLTVGWNVVLAGRLGLRIADAVCVKGYKGDAERQIGLVARLESEGGVPLDAIVKRVQREFSGVGNLHASAPRSSPSDAAPPIAIVAIMNAFNADEVIRVLTAAHASGWISNADSGESVLYLTGQARDYGLNAAAWANMPVICVGHRACEEWGIRFLAEQVREQFPAVNIDEVFEEEEPRPVKMKGERRTTTRNNG